MKRWIGVLVALGATGCYYTWGGHDECSQEYPPARCKGGQGGYSGYAGGPYGSGGSFGQGGYGGGPFGYGGGQGGAGGPVQSNCRGAMVQACLLGPNGQTAVATNVPPTTVTIVEKSVVPFAGACAEFNPCYSNPTNNPVKLKLDGTGGPWFAVLGIPGLGAGAFDAGQQLELRVDATSSNGVTNQAFSLRRAGGPFVAFGLRKVGGPLPLSDIAGTGVGLADDGVDFVDAGTCEERIHRVQFTTAGGSTMPFPPGWSTGAGGWYFGIERASTFETDAGPCGASDLYVGGSTQL